MLRDEEHARDYVKARCSAANFAMLERFAELLAAANQTQNLVARSTIAKIWLRHIADSAQLLEHVSRETSPWLDLGSGAGFPGLIVAMMKPQRNVVLIESRRLRIQWLTAIAAEFTLENCRVVGSDIRRVEAFGAAVISARAFAPLPRLVELSARFSTNETEWVLPKGRSAEQDVAQLPPHSRSRFHVKHSLTDPEGRIVVAKGCLSAPA